MLIKLINKSLLEILKNSSIREVLQKLSIHNGTIKRWFSEKKVPTNYYNDLNFLLDNKYPERSNFRAKDQFFTTKEISNYLKINYPKIKLTIINF